MLRRVFPRMAFIALVLGGCRASPDADAVLSRALSLELPLVQAAASPVVVALEGFRREQGHYPPSLAGLVPEFIAADRLARASTAMGAFREWYYEAESPGSYLLWTCRTEERHWLTGQVSTLVCMHHPVSERGLGRCTGRNALGRDRRAGDWCVSYGDAPPT